MINLAESWKNKTTHSETKRTIVYLIRDQTVTPRDTQGSRGWAINEHNSAYTVVYLSIDCLIHKLVDYCVLP